VFLLILARRQLCGVVALLLVPLAKNLFLVPVNLQKDIEAHYDQNRDSYWFAFVIFVQALEDYIESAIPSKWGCV
jgi:hypothetical protein